MGIKRTDSTSNSFSTTKMRLTIISIYAIVSFGIQAHGNTKYMKYGLSEFENIFIPPNFERSKMEALNKPIPINCFPLADRHHTYEWAGGFTQNHILDELEAEDGGTNVDRSAEVEESEVNNVNKRNEKGRDLSKDLYAQHTSSCACQTKYELLDLGYTHFPRYIVNAICSNRNLNSRKCWMGSRCKEIPYKVRVLTKRSEDETSEEDHYSALLPEPLRDFWRFRTVTIAAACQCSL